MLTDWGSFKKYWAPVLLYAGFIFYLSSIPAPLPAVKLDLSALHVPMFFVLSYLMSRALASTKLGSHGTIVFPMIVTALYGILDELHQLYVPGRTFSYVDMGFDFLGASLVVFKNWWDKLFERVNL